MREIARRLVGGVWRTGVVDEQNGNGGSQPTGSEKFQTVNAFASGSTLTWAKALIGGGDDLVDLSDTALPAIIAAGVYTLSAWVDIANTQIPEAGCTVALDAEIDSNSDADPDLHSSTFMTAGFPFAQSVGGAITWDVQAGAVFTAQFRHDVGAPITINFVAFLVRVG